MKNILDWLGTTKLGHFLFIFVFANFFMLILAGILPYHGNMVGSTVVIAVASFIFACTDKNDRWV